MSEHLEICCGTKEERYGVLLPQLKALAESSPDLIAAMANFSSAISDTFGFLWTGFYRVVADRLLLGPFQGPLACMEIRRGKGVCGTAWAEARTVVVPDVELFPGHIACSSESRSEIVVPVMRGGEVIAVLDIDSSESGTFDSIDSRFLNEAVSFLVKDF